MLKKIILILTVALVALFGSSVSVFASTFKDVPDYWATDAINWAAENGIVSGTGNGKFSPKKELTEAEFVSMLVRMAKVDVREVVAGEHWAQRYYDAAKKYELPVMGYENTESGTIAKNTVMLRGQVAKIVAAKYGFNLNLEQAVLFMYANDLSSGMKPLKSYENYGVDIPLRRDQAAVFLQKIFSSNYTSFLGQASSIKGAEIAGIAGIAIIDRVVTLAEYSNIVPLTSGAMWNGMPVLSDDQREITYQDEIFSYIQGYRSVGQFPACFKGADGKPDFSLAFGKAHASAIIAAIGIYPNNITGYMWYEDDRFDSTTQLPIVDKGPDGRYYLAAFSPWDGAQGSITYNPSHGGGRTTTTMAQFNALFNQPGISNKLDAKTKTFMYNVLKLAGTQVICTNAETLQNQYNWTGVEHVNGGSNPAPFIYALGENIYYTDACEYGVAFSYDAQTTGAPGDPKIGLTVRIQKKLAIPVQQDGYIQRFSGHEWGVSLDHDFTDDIMFK